MPGTTSSAGRTSTSTGSEVQSRSSASAFALARRPAASVTASGERLVIALLEELELLPFPVHHRPEVLGMLGSPDLRPDDEVVRVERERLAPDPQSLLLAAGREGGDPVREAGERTRVHAPVSLGGLGRLACEKAVEVPAHARVGDVEVIGVAVADRSVLVDEEPARHDAEPEQAPELARPVNEHGKADVAFLHDRAHTLLALDVLGNGDHPKAFVPLAPYALPP